jgi:hypothetical protein
MADTSNASFKWLVGDDKTRPGDVLITFKGGARLSVRPTFGCKRCGGSGRGREQLTPCKCIRDVCVAEAEKAKGHWKTVDINFSAVGEVERARVFRLEEQMAQIAAEKTAIESQAGERRERYARVIEEQRKFIANGQETLKAVTDGISALEDARALLEKQRTEVEAALKNNRANIMEQQNAAMKLANDIRQAQATIADSEAATAAIAAGKYGDRYEKLKGALAKREIELAEAKKKADKLEPKVKPVDDGPTDKVATAGA